MITWLFLFLNATNKALTNLIYGLLFRLHPNANKKMGQFLLIIFFKVLLLSCNMNPDPLSKTLLPDNQSLHNPYEQIKSIPVPEGYKRIVENTGSFTSYLRNTGLKESTTVYLFNRQVKLNQKAQFAVLNISVGDRDLQQCADAVIRLRAEYLYAQKQFDKIVFFDNNYKAYTFREPFNRVNFNKYLNRVFGMCGSASLAKQLKPVQHFSSIQPGDVIIRGGFPGHAVMVMDVAENAAGKKIYLLAQSYMPAQDIHVLVNPMHADLSPWFAVNDDHFIETPEYRFTRNELMKW